MRLSIACGVLLLASLPAATLADAPARYRIDPATSGVEAKVAFFGIGSKTASFPAISGQISGSRIASGRIDLDVTIDARALTASDRVTEGRLKGRNFFDVAAHPTVRFRGRDLAITGPGTGKVAGELTARGVTRPVTLAVRFADLPGGIGGYALSGSTSINRREFGMTAFPGIVGNKVKIRINARMVRVE